MKVRQSVKIGAFFVNNVTFVNDVNTFNSQTNCCKIEK